MDVSGKVLLSSEALPDGSIVFKNTEGTELTRFSPDQAKAMRDRLSQR